jgi:peptidyl-Lys metalloendopeptidase
MNFRLGRINSSLIAGLAMLLAFASSASAAGVRGLSVTLDSTASLVGPSEDVVVRITYRNDSQADLYLLRWQTSLKGVEGDLFDVFIDGQRAEYTGRLYKRAAPKAEDYLRIPAGGAVSADVELTSVYDMSRTGEYAIRYRAFAQDALRADDLKILGVQGLASLESNTLFLAVERDGRLQEELATFQADAEAVTKALSPSFVGCTSSRQTALKSALSNAQTLAYRAWYYLYYLPTASRPTNSAYKTWFGSYTSSRYVTAGNHYVNIYNSFAGKKFTFYCDCTDGDTFAYVYANQPYKVHLCGAFWSAPSLGIDSKAGTVVHETSHFNVVAGTRDYAYGQSSCRSLATSRPDYAVFNADSHEYFAETR